MDHDLRSMLREKLGELSDASGARRSNAWMRTADAIRGVDLPDPRSSRQ
jgi:hypothetical protein